MTPLQLLAVRHFGVGRGTRPRRTRPRADRLGRVACRPAGAPRRRPAPRPETSYPLLKETGGSVSIPPSSTGETGCGGLDASPPGRRGCQSREALPAAVTAPLPSVWRRPSCVRAAAGRPWGVVPHYPPPPALRATRAPGGRGGGETRCCARPLPPVSPARRGAAHGSPAGRQSHPAVHRTFSPLTLRQRGDTGMSLQWQRRRKEVGWGGWGDTQRGPCGRRGCSRRVRCVCLNRVGLWAVVVSGGGVACAKGAHSRLRLWAGGGGGGGSSLPSPCRAGGGG